MKLTEYIPFYRRILKLALPVVLSQVGQISVHLIDNMMVGHVGTPELAAAAFANNVFMIGMYFGMGVTYGLTPLVGNAYSQGKLDEVRHLLKNGIFTHVFAGVLLSVLMFGIYFLLPYLNQPDNVLRLAKPYYILLCCSYLPFMLFFSFKQIFEGMGNTRMAMQVTLIVNLVNVLVNYLLIFGKFGLPQMGLNGAGVGTLVARMFMPVLFIFLVARKDSYKRYFVSAHRKVMKLSRVRNILKLGIPIGFQIIVEVIAFGIGAVMMGWLGEVELAAHQIALGLASFTYMVSLGVSQANTIRVSHQMGVSDFKSLRMAAMASTQLVLFFMLIMGGVFIVFRVYLSALFTTDPVVIQVAAGLLIVAAIFQLFDGLQVVMLSTLRGMADVRLPMLMAFFAYLFVGIPTSYVLTFELGIGPQGIWYGYLVGLGTAGTLFYFRFRHIFRSNPDLDIKKRVIRS